AGATRRPAPASGSSSRRASSPRWAATSPFDRRRARARSSPSTCPPLPFRSSKRKDRGYSWHATTGGSVTRVLVIDDEAPIRLLCRVNLEAEGMEVLEASDGPSGLEQARKEKPDVILLDVMMPALDGWRVAEQLLDDDSTSEIPVIFLTARAEFRDRARGLDIGGIDYVTKPFNPLELAPLVRELLTRIQRGERHELRREKVGELRALMESE